MVDQPHNPRPPEGAKPREPGRIGADTNQSAAHAATSITAAITAGDQSPPDATTQRSLQPDSANPAEPAHSTHDDAPQHMHQTLEPFGPYRPLAILGEGGFGVVYEAEQTEPVRRRVAIKVIKPGMDSRAVVARFEAERQALAVMDHPGIAKVFGGGVTPASQGSRPYFVMELVRGVPITAFADARRMTIRARCELMRRVCAAVQHAHTKGVVHRDLKPSNILVTETDAQPAPKVIDFGIAKALHQPLTAGTVFTGPGQFVGTLEYMSPEQAGLTAEDVDTRADVYALGVILYQVLTGTLPFSAASLRDASYLEAQRLLREVEPPRPSTRVSTAPHDAVRDADAEAAAQVRGTDSRALVASLRGELDWIVMRCLEKERSRRYETVNALADDLHRFLNNEPVLARPATSGYRLRKFVSRHRGPVVAGVGSVALLAVGVGVLGMMYNWASTERDRAEQLSIDEAAQRALAEQRAAEAERARAEMETIARFQADRLDDLDPRAMGERLRGAILLAASGDDALSDADRDALRATLEAINFTDIALGSLESELFARTRAAIDTTFAAQPLIRARLLHSTAGTARRVGLLEQAESAQLAALALRREHLGSVHEDTLASIEQTGSLLRARGRYAEAEPYLREAVAGWTAQDGAESFDALRATNSLALLLKSRGRLDEAEPLYRRVADLCRQTLGPEHPDTLTTINNLGALLSDMGRNDEAEALYLETLDARTRTLGADHPDTLVSMSNLGLFYNSIGRFDESIAMQRTALAGTRRHYGNEHRSTITSLNNMGGILYRRQELDDAERVWQEAYDTASRTLGPMHPLTLDLTTNLGLLRREQGRHDAAREYFETAYNGRAEVLGPAHPYTITVLVRTGRALVDSGQLDRARVWCPDAERVARETLGTGHVRWRDAAQALVLLYERLHAAEPNAGHDTEAARWADQLAAQQDPDR